MRPIPRLDTGGRVRKNSIQGSGASASESEDDSKRIKETCVTNIRIRNDSVCSVQSSKDTTATVSQTNQNNITKFRTGSKRRILVSESARKLAEARREFLLKHENKTPDRSKLTMYDLIYYNPVTNPMKRSKDPATVPRKVSICEPEVIQEEENEDDPSSAMPVPQVKVGPDGQLIIDEQSLVIEQTNAKKSREVLAKEAIIDDDNTGNGFYKRKQKSKEWPKWETLKFYKALNTVGTDFLLMQSFFPNRTRQEIKIKFKKEEKVNRNLVEKALAYHQEFDTEMLEKSLATFEDSEKEFNTQGKQKDKKGHKSEKRRRSCRIVATSIGEMDASDEDEDQSTNNSVSQNDDVEANDNPNQQPLKRTTKHICKKLKEEDITISEEVESFCSNTSHHSDSDTEIYHVRPTRSGRLPKVKKLQGPDINTLDGGIKDNDLVENETESLPENGEKVAGLVHMSEGVDINPTEVQNTETLKTVIPDINQVEPGSLVILSKESPEEPGKSVLQVYMVSSNIAPAKDKIEPNITLVDLSPELLATVTTRLSDVEPISLTDHE